MIIRSTTWLGLLLSGRGTVLSRVWPRVLVITAIAGLVTWLHLEREWFGHSLTPLPFSLVGLALGIFLGFRNNTSYDRFWEGRKLWGALVNASRTWARQVLTLIDNSAPAGTGRQLVYGQIAYVHSLRLHLRSQDKLEELAHVMPEAERQALAPEKNRPVAILQRQGERVAALYRAGHVHAMHLPVLEQTLTELTGIQGGCERIKSTPIPFTYTVLIHRLVAFYCFALPFGIADTVGLYTPLVALMVSYAFFGLDAIGDEIEEPFGLDLSDLPLSTLSRMIEVNLRQSLGETDLPPLLTPDGHGVLR